MSPGLSLGLLALVGFVFLGWQIMHARPRLNDAVGRLAPLLAPLGLEPDGGEESFEHCVQRYKGRIREREARVRVLERPGRERLLVWVDLFAPATLVEDLIALPEQLGEVRVRRVRGGYRLVLRRVNDLGWMADVELGLRAVDHDGRTSIHARRVAKATLRLGFECAVAELPGTLERAEQLVAALQASAIRVWARAAEERGLELAPWEMGFRPIQGRLRGCAVRAVPTLEGTVVRATLDAPRLRGIRRVVHKDLGEGTPTGNAVLDMLVAVEGSCEAWDDEELVAALLEVVHAWPGSELRPEEVLLRAGRHLGEEVGPALDAVARLAELCNR